MQTIRNDFPVNALDVTIPECSLNFLRTFQPFFSRARARVDTHPNVIWRAKKPNGRHPPIRGIIKILIKYSNFMVKLVNPFQSLDEIYPLSQSKWLVETAKQSAHTIRKWSNRSHSWPFFRAPSLMNFTLCSRPSTFRSPFTAAIYTSNRLTSVALNARAVHLVILFSPFCVFASWAWKMMR